MHTCKCYAKTYSISKIACIAYSNRASAETISICPILSACRRQPTRDVRARLVANKNHHSSSVVNHWTQSEVKKPIKESAVANDRVQPGVCITCVYGGGSKSVRACVCEASSPHGKVRGRATRVGGRLIPVTSPLLSSERATPNSSTSHPVLSHSFPSLAPTP